MIWPALSNDRLHSLLLPHDRSGWCGAIREDAVGRGGSSKLRRKPPFSAQPRNPPLRTSFCQATSP
ncbi:hypothetical protein, partial [Paraburkholderia ginsengisoli]|uniref:hypothetical protein n=1 Tax=Paraburkholderia ginsengisoli TaxID=311231 RepID=UPI001C3F33E9